MPSSNQITSTTGQWTTTSSPYNLGILPRNVLKCYGCSRPFAEKYRSPSENVVSKHRGRRIRGFDKDGRVTYGADFQNTFPNIYLQNTRLSTIKFILTIAFLAPWVLMNSAQVLMLKSNLIVNRYYRVLVVSS